MSYQRAVVNCRRCYALAIQETKANVSWRPGELDRALIDKDSLWQSRNEAMQALKDEIDRCMVSHPDWARSRIEKAEKALDSCMNCVYAKSEIAEVFHPVNTEDGSV